MEAILNLPEPKCTRDVMRLTGRMAALTRFRSKEADKALPFFQLLRGNKTFKWGEEERTAFAASKETSYGHKTERRREVAAIHFSITQNGSSSSVG